MKKLQTIAEMTEGMNEFQKFVFFHKRNDERVVLVNKCHLLFKYSGMNMTTIAKAIRVSWRRFMSYYLGEEPMPYNFLIGFNSRLEEQLAECQKKKDKEEMDRYLNSMGIARDILSSDGKTTPAPISSPSKATA